LVSEFRLSSISLLDFRWWSRKRIVGASYTWGLRRMRHLVLCLGGFLNSDYCLINIEHSVICII